MSGTRERPILFSAPMVRALLAGTKTQTRRIVKPAPIPDAGAGGPWVWSSPRTKDGVCGFVSEAAWAAAMASHCPHGVPGDRLYVRETWGVGNRPCPHQGWIDGIEYRADCVSDDAPPLHDIIPGHVEADSFRDGWRPSTAMPRWASRITLEITDVRVERLNDISEADAEAEGVQEPSLVPTLGAFWSSRDGYAKLWEHINGKGSWAANPWVWAVSVAPVSALPSPVGSRAKP